MNNKLIIAAILCLFVVLGFIFIPSYIAKVEEKKLESEAVPMHNQPTLLETPKSSMWEFTNALKHTDSGEAIIGSIKTEKPELYYADQYKIALRKEPSLISDEPLYSLVVSNIYSSKSMPVTEKTIDDAYNSISTAVDNINKYSAKINSGEIERGDTKISLFDFVKGTQNK